MLARGAAAGSTGNWPRQAAGQRRGAGHERGQLAPYLKRLEVNSLRNAARAKARPVWSGPQDCGPDQK